jgi:hypothetical protein
MSHISWQAVAPLGVLAWHTTPIIHSPIAFAIFSLKLYMLYNP